MEGLGGLPRVPELEPEGETVSTEQARVEAALKAKTAFDRWIAEHDRQVAERAWDEGHLVHGEDYRHNGPCRDSGGCIADNPYLKTGEQA